MKSRVRDVVPANMYVLDQKKECVVLETVVVLCTIFSAHWDDARVLRAEWQVQASEKKT